MRPTERRRARPLVDLVLREDEVSGGDLWTTTEDVLTRLIPSDDAFWIGVDFAAAAVEITRRDVSDPTLEAALQPVVADDPIVRSFLAAPQDLSPRRQSDVTTVDAWERTATSRVGFAGRPARYRLSSVFALDPPARGFGWSAFRDDRDFSDQELETVSTLYPLLDAAITLAGPVKRRFPDSPEALSPREVDMLRMLSSGRTARAIASDRGIAEGTVRKHLEHIYDKLDSHDRLTAVNEGRRRGYL